ncbi:hypothetical protein STVA_42220 [Allostella vacuolata]|nr:hypothetical protein STVA_42220 [Stella vacuolata]
MAEGDGATVKSAARVLAILEFFDEVQREARVSEVAERLAYPQSSTSVLLQSLTRLGYLDYDAASRTYLPTTRVALLGTWLDAGPVRDGSLVRMLQDLSGRTEGTVILAARNGIYAQYIHVIQSQASLRFHIPQGARRLLVWSATGTALLAEEADDAVAALVRRTNVEVPGPDGPIDVRAVRGNLESLRRAGYFFSQGLVTAGAGSIAMPLPGRVDRHHRPLAVAISGLLDRFRSDEARIAAMMREAIARYLAA